MWRISHVTTILGWQRLFSHVLVDVAVVSRSLLPRSVTGPVSTAAGTLGVSRASKRLILSWADALQLSGPATIWPIRYRVVLPEFDGFIRDCLPPLSLMAVSLTPKSTPTEV